MTTNTSFEEFVSRAQRGTFVPICTEVMADLLTPVSAFLKIAEHSDHAFLFESVVGRAPIFLAPEHRLAARRGDSRPSSSI